ncbi:MAG: substrate-binding domain-containing protein [Spirochaetales bacterium]|nr:substrate-binding domain-containing protein [Spirochaetales bacterium]
MKQKHRPTVGFAIDWIENYYQEKLLYGVKQAAKERDVNLLCFVGGALNSPRSHEVSRNSIYRFISKENLDGLVIASGPIGIFSTIEELSRFCSRFSSMPIVSIAQSLPNICSVIEDNALAFKKLLIHMHQIHGHQKIAFVSGPKTNLDSIARLEVYRELVSEFSLPVNDDYIFYGEFIPESGCKAVKEFLDNRKLDITCIAAANDDMAYGVIEELRRRGIIVPHDVAVMGFDNQIVSSLITPPLSTVEPFLYEQSRKAVNAVLDILEGKNVPHRIIVETKEIYRESCGCLIKNEAQQELHKQSEDQEQLSDSAVSYLRSIKEKFGEDFFYQLKTQVDIILDFLVKSVEFRDSDIFIYQLNRLLYSNYTREFNENLYQSLINYIFFLSYNLFSKNEDKAFCNIIFHHARILISTYIQRMHNYSAYIEERELQIYRDLSEELVAMPDLESVTDFLYLNLPKLGIKSCYFSLYNDISLENPLTGLSNIILAYDEKRKINDLRPFQGIPTKTLLPEEILENQNQFVFFVEPVYFGRTQLGVVLYSVEEAAGFSHDIVRRVFLNMAMKATIFLQQLQKQRSNLEQANQELVDLLNKLETAQDRLIQSEKMAALGGLVAGVAHEINTPIGVGVTAASHLKKKSKELISLFEEGKLKKSDFENYLEIADNATKMILSNLQRAYELIRSFKQIAVDQSTEEKRTFNVKNYFEEVLTSLHPKIKKTEIIITLHCSETLKINSYPGVFSQVLTNLVMNSLIHGFEKRKTGEINIEIKKCGKELNVEYADNGQGIAEENLNRVFEPFFTTKRNQGGTGLGLHIIFNLITQKLFGTVKCYSSLDQGARFVILLPVDFIHE